MAVLPKAAENLQQLYRADKRVTQMFKGSSRRALAKRLSVNPVGLLVFVSNECPW